MRYLSLFSGIEAASCAWEPLGWEPVAFSEIDPFCCELLRQRYPGVPNLGDITKIDWSRFNEQYGAVDVVVGGSPCTSFSIAGGRTSLAGESGLMFEYIRAVRECRPRWFVWENVPGALTAKGLDGQAGGAFGQLLCEMGELGYGLAWRVLDSQFFNVAQRRERVFLVGHLGDMRAEKVLFEPESLRWDTPPSREKRKELAAALGRGDQGVHAHTLKLRHTGSPNIGGGSGPLVQEELSATLGTGNDQTLVHDEPIGFKYHQGAKARSLGADSGISPTLTADYNQPAICLQTDHLSQNGTNASEEVCKTLDTQTPPAVVCMTDTQPNAKIDDGWGTCGTLTNRMHKDPPVICMADDNGKSAVEEDMCGTLKVGSAAPMCAMNESGVMQRWVGSLDG